MKKRHGVLALLGAVSVITFVDRLAIAVAGPSLQHDVHLTPVQWGWVLSSYVIANTVFEIPSGALGDRLWATCRAQPHCRVVVHLHCAHRLVPHLLAALHHSLFVRGGRGGRLSQCRRRDSALVSQTGAGAQPGRGLGREPAGRSTGAPHPRSLADASWLASRLLDIGHRGTDVDGGLVDVVS